MRQLADIARTYQPAVWHDALLASGHTKDTSALAERLCTDFLARRRQTFVLFPETMPNMTALRQHYRLGIVTNGASDLQREKIVGNHLTDWFDTIVVSGDVGVGKPDARVFTRALERLHVSPDETVMIGDNIICDIQGAQQLGMHTIWVWREAEPPIALPCQPDHCVTDLTDLVSFLETCGW